MWTCLHCLFRLGGAHSELDRIMEEIEINKYLKPEPLHKMGRPGYNRVNMLKTILFGFMDTGYASLRELEDRCKVNLRYMYLMDHETQNGRAVKK